MNSTTFTKTKTETCSMCKRQMKNPFYCSTCDAPIGYTLPDPPLIQNEEAAIHYAKGYLHFAQEELRVTACDVEHFTTENLTKSLFTLANFLCMVENLLPAVVMEEEAVL